MIPLFSSHFSLPQEGSLLTLEEPGKGKVGGPVSVFDLSQSVGLKEVVIADSRPDGFIQAYKVSTKLGVKFCYGLRLVVCADGDLKDEASVLSQSKVIVFAKDTEGYHKLVSIWSRAATRGFYFTARTSWTWLREQWSDHLSLALPWASSFIAKNVLSFACIVPDLPCTPWVFRECETQLPFARLIDTAIDRYVKSNPTVPTQDIKSIYYARSEDFVAYQVMRAIGNRSSFAAPNVDHLSSDAFSWESFKCLTDSANPPMMEGR